MSLAFLRKRKTPSPPLERTHEVGGRSLPLRIVENDRATRLTLRIAAGGTGLRITVPPGVSQREINRFIERHQGWLEKRIAKLPDQPQVRPGIKVPVRGVPHLIVHEPDKRGMAEAVQTEDGPVLIVHGDRHYLPRRVADFLKREAKREIEALVAKHTATVGRRAKTVRFKDTTSRWGSCTSDGALSFSWRIAMAPGTVIDYLVAHEVAHLIEMNHGPKFWKLCKELCPRTDEAKTWLKRNGPALQAIGFG